jgi:hypothetical protein
MFKYRQTNLVVLLITLLFLSSTYVLAQDETVDENKKVYWFFIKVKEIEDVETGSVSYFIQRKKKKTFAGTIEDFDNSLWENLGKNGFLAIGPFSKLHDVETSYVFYKTGKCPEIEDSILKKEEKVYWFIWHYTKSKSLRPNYKRYLPKAIASGNFEDFQLFLDENILMRIITIGPFYSEEEARRSQKFYRVEEHYW